MSEVHTRAALRLCAAAAVLLAIAAAAVPCFISQKLQQGIREAVVWSPDSPPEVDARFRGTPGGPDLLFSVWFFNITNVADMRQGAKPKLAQVGPFVYQKFRIKVETWWDERGRVAVKERNYHVWRPDLSSLDPTTTQLVTLNLPLLGVLAALHGQVGPSYQQLMDLLLAALARWSDEEHRVDGLFTRRTPHELLWGYEDALLVQLAALLPPGLVPATRFGLVPNDTRLEDALARPASVINTGRGDLGDLWEMEVAEGWQSVTSWNKCIELVRGTDGFQFAPGIQRNQSLRVWITELFRSAVVLYRGEVQSHGLCLFRYTPDEEQGEPNACHYQRLRGLMNVSVPLAVGPHGNPSNAHGPPVYLSLPHYCRCDERLQQGVEGLACDMDAHNTFLDVEPITGATMRAAKRLQLSTELSPWMCRNLEPRLLNTSASVYLPVFWAEEASEISPDLAQAFRSTVYRAQSAAKWSRVVLGVAALLCICCVVASLLLPVMATAGSQAVVGVVWVGGMQSAAVIGHGQRPHDAELEAPLVDADAGV